MTRRQPIDNDHRIAVTSQIGLNHFVEAGAGTGKTDTLLKRVVGLVTASSGRVQMRDIAAITFTERAAEELRGRIRERLAGGDPESLLQVDEAAIGTIHSFARRILADHGLAIGIPPGFEVASSSAVDRGNAETWQLVHQAWQADPQCRADLDTLAALGMRESALRPLFFEMLYVRSRIARAALVPGAGPDVRAAAADLADLVRQIRARADVECGKRSDKLYLAIWGEKLDSILALANELASGTAAPDTARAVALAPATVRFGNIGSAGNWGRPAKEVRTALQEDIERGCGAVASAAIDAPVRSLLAAALGLFDEAERQRIRAGALQFDDLLVLCHRLLREHPGIAARVARTYRVIMVDEFQDTDPLQWEIVRLITSAGSSDDRPRPGSLVLVGDPKQSIYGFRGADIATYERVRGQFPGASRKELAVNFRTVKPVVDWVNRLYGPLFEDTSEQVGYEPLTAHHNPDHPNPGPPVVVLRTDAGEALGEVEADLVVTAIDEIRQRRWLVTEQDRQTWDRRYARPATFRDIAILVPVRTTVGLLLNALDAAGVPYRSNDVSIVFDRPVTRGLKSALRAIAREDDQLEVWGALKSPLFGLDDRMLLDHARTAGAGRWRVARREGEGPDEPVGPVVAALAVLGEARRVASAGRPVEVLQYLIDTCDVPAVIAAQPRAAFEAECLRYLVDQAQAWEDAGGAGLEAFVSWLATASGDLKSGLGVSDDRVADAIQISTVHGAKGLEFPIVILAGMSSPPRSAVPQLLVGKEGEVEFSVSGNPPAGALPIGKTPPSAVRWFSWGYQALAEQRRLQEEAELQRLLYVAMTRAQDHLVVSAVGKPRSRAARLLDWLPEAAELSQRRAVSIAVPVTPQPPLPPSHPLERAADVAAQPTLLRPSMATALAQRLGVEARAPRWEAVPTADDADAAEQVEVADEEQRRDGGIGGTAMGNAVHEALERIVLDGPGADVPLIVAQTAAAHHASRAEAERRVAAALLSPTVQEAMAARCWPELTFTYGIADAAAAGIDVVDGVADLVYESGGRLVVADYKTDAAPSEETKLHYAEQLAVYAKILTDLTGMQVARLVVVWLPPSGPAQDIEV